MPFSGRRLDKYKKPFPCPFNFFGGTSKTVALLDSPLRPWKPWTNIDIPSANVSVVFKLGQITFNKLTDQGEFTKDDMRWDAYYLADIMFEQSPARF